MTIQITPFGQLEDGTPVQEILLQAGDLKARVLDYGAIVRTLHLTGHVAPLVLGADTMQGYLSDMQFFGTIVGRFANRIAHGQFSINGKTYQVPRNFLGKHALHSGPGGVHQRIWHIQALTPSSVHFTLSLADGDMGFPGDLNIDLMITLTSDNALTFQIEASSNQITPCSFAHHGYFILDNSGSLAQHRLHIPASEYLEVDQELIPSGNLVSVAQTPLDFRGEKSLSGERLDHCFNLLPPFQADTLPNSPSPSSTEAGATTIGPSLLKPLSCALKPVARLSSDLSGLSLEVESNQPGLVVYNCAYLPEAGITGLEGRIYKPNAGIAFETQGWPDAPNHAHFPNSLLHPGERYLHQVKYRFERA